MRIATKTERLVHHYQYFKKPDVLTFSNVYYMSAYKSNQGTEILSNFKSMFAPKLSESLREKVVEDVMRFPTQQRRQARLTQLIQKLDRTGVNRSDVVSILKKLKEHGVTFYPGYQKELMDLLQNNYMVGKTRKRKRSGKRKQTHKY